MSPRPPWNRKDAVVKWIGDLFAAREAASTSTHVRLPPAVGLVVGKVRGAGRPKMTEGERRAVNLIHDAADKLLVIEHLLRENYPGQKTGIRDRAIEIAAQRCNTDSLKLGNYMRRSRRDRSRISA
jgi:hypothetical protein